MVEQGNETQARRHWGLPASVVALGLALTVLLAVMRGPAWLGLAVIGVGAVMQWMSTQRHQ